VLIEIKASAVPEALLASFDQLGEDAKTALLYNLRVRYRIDPYDGDAIFDIGEIEHALNELLGRRNAKRVMSAFYERLARS
jgi:hypothetical protein